MEYDMDIKMEFSCFQWNMIWIQRSFLVFSGIDMYIKWENDMDIQEFSCFQWNMIWI